jgi:hypothetical protein
MTGVLIVMVFITALLACKNRVSPQPKFKFGIICASALTILLCIISWFANSEVEDELDREAVFNRAVAEKIVATLPSRVQSWKILALERTDMGVYGDRTIAAIKSALGNRGQIAYRLAPTDVSPEGLRRIIFQVKPDLVLSQICLPRDLEKQSQLFLGEEEDSPALPPVYLLNVEVHYLKTWLRNKAIIAAILQKDNYNPSGVPDSKDPTVFDQRFIFIDANNLSIMPSQMFSPEAATAEVK